MKSSCDSKIWRENSQQIKIQQGVWQGGVPIPCPLVFFLVHTLTFVIQSYCNVDGGSIAMGRAKRNYSSELYPEHN